MFGLERAGLNDEIRSSKKINYIRIMQKEGEILVAEDFTALGKKANIRPNTVCSAGRPKTQ